MEREIVLVCPRHCVPGQTIFYRDHAGKRCVTTVPPGLRPGMRFRVKKHAFGAPEDSRKEATSSGENATPTPANARRQAAILDAYERKEARKLNLSQSCPSLRQELSREDRELVDAYRERRRQGDLGDDNWWGKQGFRTKPPSARKQQSHRPSDERQRKNVNGYGAPKWSPYYRAATTTRETTQDAVNDSHETTTTSYRSPPETTYSSPNDGAHKKKAPMPKKRREVSILGDQAWWGQYGFKGAISEQKKRDYGNGVPSWSPYHRSDDPRDDAPPRDPVNLPPDAFWFKQWGFRTGGVSEAKRRDYGYGVPMWSPYYRSKEPHSP